MPRYPSCWAAVQLALNEVIGAYAIAILDKEHPEEIIAARKKQSAGGRYW